MDSEELVKAPNNGIIYESTQKDGFKYAILYDPQRLEFYQYLQIPWSEQQARYEYYEEDYEEYYEEYYEEEEEEYHEKKNEYLLIEKDIEVDDYDSIEVIYFPEECPAF